MNLLMRMVRWWQRRKQMDKKKILFFVSVGIFFIGIIMNMANSTDKHTQSVITGAVEKMHRSIVEAADEKASGGKDSADGIKEIISDYLRMDSLKFQEKYAKDELYEKGIFYCDKNAWKYDGSQLDAFQDDPYVVEDITAIRIYKKQPVPVYHNMNIGERTEQYSSKLNINYNTEYAVSIYSTQSDDNISHIVEISFIKIGLDQGAAPEELYYYIESDYYEVRENLENETWILSPDREKAACVSNGALPKHPAQIFIWYKNDKPLTVFRRTWEHRIVGWIDDNHLVCYAVDVDTPVLIHLEKNEIEPIINEKCKYDTYGVEYKIQDHYMIAQCLGEQLYQWEILKKDGEVFLIKL